MLDRVGSEDADAPAPPAAAEASGGGAVRIDVGVRPRPLKVALLRPPTVVALGSLTTCGPTPPVGVAYIGAALRSAGHDVQILDAPAEAMDRFDHLETSIGTIRRIGLPPRELVERIRPGTRVIGISNMFVHEWPTVREIAEAARRRFPDATVVLGGENATAFWRWAFAQTDAIDAVVLGEGDRTVVEVVDRVSVGAPLDGLQGVVVHRAGEEAVDGGLPVRMRRLDQLPRPAWDLLPIEEYFRHRAAASPYRGTTMPIVATRGCPYQCSFCSSPQMWTTRYVVRDPEDIADEIAEYVERYGVTNVEFVDLTPIAKRKWTLELCDAIEAKQLDISIQIPIGTRAEVFDEHLLSRLRDIGVTYIFFAPETGSKRMLERYDKRADLADILTAIRTASGLGLTTCTHVIVGHPDETWADRFKSWAFMLRAAFAGLAFSNATGFFPYPGSKDFQSLVESGRVVVDDDYCYDGLSRGKTGLRSYAGNASPATIQAMQTAMVASTLAVSHLLHPGRIVHLVRNVLKGGPENTVLEQFIRVRRSGYLGTSGQPSEGNDEQPPVVLSA